MTSKLPVTIPKALAVEYGIEPGTEIEFVPAGETIRVQPPRKRVDRATRLRRFDEATERQRQRGAPTTRASSSGKGWRREDLDDRARPR